MQVMSFYYADLFFSIDLDCHIQILTNTSYGFHKKSQVALLTYPEKVQYGGKGKRYCKKKKNAQYM